MTEELKETLERLIAHFDMDDGYPATTVRTPDTVVFGTVGEELGDILYDIVEILEEQ